MCRTFWVEGKGTEEESDNELLDPREDQVLGHLAPKSTHAQDTDTGRPEPLLGTQPPEPDLPVVELGLLLADLGTVGHHVGKVVWYSGNSFSVLGSMSARVGMSGRLARWASSSVLTWLTLFLCTW